jgi:hypothetical protein
MTATPFEGIFHRPIDLRAWDERTAVGWLEDEFHHFGVTLIHDGARILDLRTAAPRHPWTTCAAAGIPLRGLIGQPLARRCSAIGSMIEMRHQCTHLFDLTGLLLAHAHAGRSHRRYHGTVRPLADLVRGAPAHWLRASLDCDGQQVMTWDVHDDTIMAPPPYAGRSMLQGFRHWVESREQEEAEHALVLRRVVFVAGGRRISIQHARVAADMGQGPVCHSFQPEFRDLARRVGDTDRRFDDCPETMLALIDTQAG